MRKPAARSLRASARRSATRNLISISWFDAIALRPAANLMLSFGSLKSFHPRSIRVKNLFQADSVDDVFSRIDKLQPTTQHQWGKMDVAQMMAHCSTTLDVASGRVVLPRMFIGRILGPFVRAAFTNEKPFSRNGPTDKSFVIADKRDCAREQEQLKARVQLFHEGGEA